MGGRYPRQALERARSLFFDALDDDMNTSGALGAVFENIVGGVRGLVESDIGTEAADFLLEAWSILGIAPALERQRPVDLTVRMGDSVIAIEAKRYVDAHWPADRQEQIFRNVRAKIGDRLDGDITSLATLIQTAIVKRLQARQNKDFAFGDQVRDALSEEGIVLRDSKDGTTWTVAAR